MPGAQQPSPERPSGRGSLLARHERRAGRATLAVGLVLVLGLLAGCSEALQQATGRVISVDSPAFGRVDGFVLSTEEGRMTFDTSELVFQPEFPAVHLNEHRLLGSPIVVTYRRDGERLVVTKLADV